MSRTAALHDKCATPTCRAQEGWNITTRHSRLPTFSMRSGRSLELRFRPGAQVHRHRFGAVALQSATVEVPRHAGGIARPAAPQHDPVEDLTPVRKALSVMGEVRLESMTAPAGRATAR